MSMRFGVVLFPQSASSARRVTAQPVMSYELFHMILEELTTGIESWSEMGRMTIRLVASAILGAAIGYQREKAGKAAGLRTHMLVSLGSTLFLLGIISVDFDIAAQSRVIQGIVAGVGFMGAGSILKISEEKEIHGLTTAAGVWMTSAIGVAVGLGAIGIATLGTVVTLLILSLLQRLTR